MLTSSANPLLISVSPTIIAQDSAASTAYSNGYSGQNGGFGFGAFTVVTSTPSNTNNNSFAGSFIGDATKSENGSGGGVNSSGKSFGTYANGAASSPADPSVTVTRGFNTGLTSGGSFSLDFLTGYNNGGTVGVTLITGSASITGSAFQTRGADPFGSGTTVPVGSFVYNQAQGAYDFNGNNTRIGYNSGLIHLVYSINSATAYTLVSTGAVSFTGSGTYSGTLSGFQFQQTNSDSNGGDPYNAFFNNLKETAQPAASAAPEPSQVGVLLIVCLGGLALAASKRLVRA